MGNRFNIFIAIIATGISSGWIPHVLAGQEIGDRLVVVVNNFPYTQLQIEAYLDIKEALRDDPAKSQLVDGTNWRVATPSFVHDMTLYQEANRTAGFRPSKELLAKAMDRVKATIKTQDRYHQRFATLGIDDLILSDHVARILTIESLRKSRSSATSKKPGKSATNGSKDAADGQWERDLVARSIVRWFENSDNWVELNPLK